MFTNTNYFNCIFLTILFLSSNIQIYPYIFINEKKQQTLSNFTEKNNSMTTVKHILYN